MPTPTPAAKSPSQRSARKRRARRRRLLAAHDDACINCAFPFKPADIRGYFGPSHDDDVGPFCVRCYRLIKLHEHGAPA
jgi:hypothetical protein